MKGISETAVIACFIPKVHIFRIIRCFIIYNGSSRMLSEKF